MRWSFVLSLCLVTLGCGGKQPVAETPKTTAASGETLPLGDSGTGYLVAPPADGKKHGAVLVIQEWWGLNDWIRANTHRFAGKGYVALAVDLYRGKSTDDKDVAHELMRGLPEDRAMRDISAGFAALSSRADVDPARIAIVGWCMGGGYALSFATAEPRLRAAVVNYGRLITDVGSLDAIKASLLGNFAGNDHGIPPADVQAFQKTMTDIGKEIDVKIYDGAGHAFMNPNAKQSYNDAAAADAWARIDAFLAKTIGG